MKKIIKLFESGVNIEYRCIKCRSCGDCKRAIETERVSLCEEAEDQELWDSVVLNFDGKRIEVCMLLRGKEEDFLSNNENIARKVLTQQCKKHQSNEETKALIKTALNKLTENGHAKPFSDLSETQQKKILDKKVQHFIPWRIVYNKNSLSTPCRLVFDATTKTEETSLGGGRCLNDLVMKGRILTINLVRMLLRFIVGLFATAGDIRMFYNALKMIEDQWNLQQILYKEDIDVDAEVIHGVLTTAIYGVKCVSAQSEVAKEKLANHIRPEDPELADTLKNSVFVDDIGDSKQDEAALNRLTDAADKLFKRVGMEVKGWTKSGYDPSEELSSDGLSVWRYVVVSKTRFLGSQATRSPFWTNLPGKAGP